jgi:hypothetical protein
MIAAFFDRQESANPLNGCKVYEPDRIAQILRSLQNRTPFLCELVGDAGFNLLLGVGGQFGCAQYSSRDGSPPYFMAVAEQPAATDEYIEFLAGDTPTPIARHYCLTFGSIQSIATHFVITGQRHPGFFWEQI